MVRLLFILFLALPCFGQHLRNTGRVMPFVRVNWTNGASVVVANKYLTNLAAYWQFETAGSWTNLLSGGLDLSIFDGGNPPGTVVGQFGNALNASFGANSTVQRYLYSPSNNTSGVQLLNPTNVTVHLWFNYTNTVPSASGGTLIRYASSPNYGGFKLSVTSGTTNLVLTMTKITGGTVSANALIVPNTWYSLLLVMQQITGGGSGDSKAICYTNGVQWTILDVSNGGKGSGTNVFGVGGEGSGSTAARAYIDKLLIWTNLITQFTNTDANYFYTNLSTTIDP